jgi:hypothetical protein
MPISIIHVPVDVVSIVRELACRDAYVKARHWQRSQRRKNFTETVKHSNSVSTDTTWQFLGSAEDQ